MRNSNHHHYHFTVIYSNDYCTKSMDEIDREKLAKEATPIEVKGIQMTEAGNIPLVRIIRQ